MFMMQADEATANHQRSPDCSSHSDDSFTVSIEQCHSNDVVQWRPIANSSHITRHSWPNDFEEIQFVETRSNSAFAIPYDYDSMRSAFPQPYISGASSSDQRDAANIKKRRRNFCISEAFDLLRNTIPNLPKDTKVSKLQILHIAIDYIKFLDGLLGTNGQYQVCTIIKY